MKISSRIPRCSSRDSACFSNWSSTLVSSVTNRIGRHHPDSGPPTARCSQNQIRRHLGRRHLLNAVQNASSRSIRACNEPTRRVSASICCRLLSLYSKFRLFGPQWHFPDGHHTPAGPYQNLPDLPFSCPTGRHHRNRTERYHERTSQNECLLPLTESDRAFHS